MRPLSRLMGGRFVLVGVCLVAFLQPARAADGPLGKKIEEFSLPELGGKQYSLGVFRKNKVVVVAFLGIECPLAKLYAPRLAALAKEYHPKGVAFCGINSNAQDSHAEIVASNKESGIDFPFLKDADQKVADLFGAQRTPEVFVLDEGRVVRYWGRIDDQHSVGIARDKPSREDLRLAIDELLAGKEVSQPSHSPAGCLIGRLKQPKGQGEVTWSSHIAKIVQDRCVECHRPGQVGPFSLVTYEDAAPWCDAIAEVVLAGRMPPWHADPKHGKFSNESRLTEAQKSLITRWAEDGAPQGDAKSAPAPRKFIAGWQLSRAPDLVVPMRKVPYKVPAEGNVDYQYFTADPGFKEDKWVEAAEIVPGNRSVVHHAIVFVKAKNSNSRHDEGEGFLSCFVPGTRAQPYPPGMAKLIPAGSKLSFQIHYTTTGKAQEDLTSIGFLFAKPEQVKHVVMTGSANVRRITIPPHAADHKLEALSMPAPVEIQLLSLMPHMHLRGKAFTYESVPPGGKSEMLLSVPRYDFGWQTSYLLSEPKRFPAGTKFRCVAQYDNSAENPANPDPAATVHWGPKSNDEMMFGYFDYAMSREHFKAFERRPPDKRP